MVIRDGKIANYHPYPPTPWNASPRDTYGTPGPYEDAVQNTPIFEENDRENFKGIDIMRAVRSFDPCLPCGVHMYLGDGKMLEQLHSPTQSVTGRVEWQRVPRSPASLQRDRRADRGRCSSALSTGGPVARERAEELVRLVTDLYGAGLERLLEVLADAGRLDEALLDALAADELVASLLLVHGLHPYDVGTRVARRWTGPALPRLARRRRRAARRRRRRRRPAAAAGQLRRLPVLVGDAPARRRGGHRGGRAGGHLDRGGGPDQVGGAG